MGQLIDGWGLVGINDGLSVNTAAHFVASKKLLPYLNGEFFHTGYSHCFCDNELKDIASELDRFIWCEDAMIKHDHPLMGGTWDDGYLSVHEDGTNEKDQVLYIKRRIQRNGFKLGIALPLTYNWAYVRFMLSFLQMDKPDFNLLLPDEPNRIDVIRNGLVLKAMNCGCSHLAFMDTDQIYPQDGLMRLLDHDLPFVSAVVHRRYEPFDPILYWYEKEVDEFIHAPLDLCYTGKLLSVDATGQGFNVTKMETFLDVGLKDWFKIETKENGDTVGEDISFCNKLRGKGIEMYADTAVQVKHLSLFEVTQKTHELFMKGKNKSKWASPSTALLKSKGIL